MNDDDVFECVFKNDMLFKLINFPLLLFFFAFSLDGTFEFEWLPLVMLERFGVSQFCERNLRFS